jgi:hypothetical protein
MSVLYVTQPDAVLSKTHEAFNVALKQQMVRGKNNLYQLKQ